MSWILFFFSIEQNQKKDWLCRILIHSMAKGVVASRSIGGQQRSYFYDHVYFAVIFSYITSICLLIYLSHFQNSTLWSLWERSESLFVVSSMALIKGPELLLGLRVFHCYGFRISLYSYTKLRSVEILIERCWFQPWYNSRVVLLEFVHLNFYSIKL